MCVPGCRETVLRRQRRNFLKTAGVALGGVLAGCRTDSSSAGQGAAPGQQTSFSRVVDLTHVLDDRFPTFEGIRYVELETMTTYAENNFNMLRWHLVEHVGTHLDAPFHFSADQNTADAIPADDLILPLAVVDIRQKAAKNPDAQLTPDDIRAWESANGPLPDRACVAMYSGWEAGLGSDKFRNADDEGVMHFPGFHVEAVQFLLQERNATAIVVDTLSLDYGPSADFAVHNTWLPANRWGMECVAHLGDLPPVGATFVAGAPKIRGASGGPSRVFALV